MDNSPSAVLEELAGALDTAVRLASEGRYAELTAHAAAVERAASALDGLQRLVEEGLSSQDAVREGCQRVRRKIFTFSEVMRHATMVQAGLLQVDGSVRDGYNHRGAFGQGLTASRGQRLINEEA